MAKKKYLTVGKVRKPSPEQKADGMGVYIQIDGYYAKSFIKELQKLDEKGKLFLSLDSKEKQLTRLENMEANGKLSTENAEKARARVDRIDETKVMYDIVLAIAGEEPAT